MSLKAGDPVRNALLELATQLLRVEKIPTNRKIEAPVTRVPPTQPAPYKIKSLAPSPRVQRQITPPLAHLQEHSTTPLRVRFYNQPTHKYNLRLRTTIPANQQNSFCHRALQYLTAHSIFQPTLNHIY